VPKAESPKQEVFEVLMAAPLGGALLLDRMVEQPRAAQCVVPMVVQLGGVLLLDRMVE
jgi:hypothetical protein